MSEGKTEETTKRTIKANIYIAGDVKDGGQVAGRNIDLKSKKLIIAKGILFLIIALACFALILIQLPSWNTALLLACLVWAACRFYYFLFYVLEKYVNPSLRYAGILALIQTIWQRDE